jgi:hypothetical protein
VASAYSEPWAFPEMDVFTVRYKTFKYACKSSGSVSEVD